MWTVREFYVDAFSAESLFGFRMIIACANEYQLVLQEE